MTFYPATHSLTPPVIRDRLEQAQTARQQKLDSLPANPADLVTAAHRASVERILGDVRAAVRRLDDGTYGRCLHCGSAIAPERLEALPWSATCDGPCAAQALTPCVASARSPGRVARHGSANRGEG